MPSRIGAPSHWGLSVGGISGEAAASRKRHSYSSQPRRKSPRNSEASASPKCGPGNSGVERESPLGCSDRLVELEPVVVDTPSCDAQCGSSGANAAAVLPARSASSRRPVIRYASQRLRVIERGCRGECGRALHHRHRFAHPALAVGDYAEQVYRAVPIRRPWRRCRAGSPRLPRGVRPAHARSRAAEPRQAGRLQPARRRWCHHRRSPATGPARGPGDQPIGYPSRRIAGSRIAIAGSNCFR